GSGGLPLPGGRGGMTSPSWSPFTSWARTEERRRSGPRPPVASLAWQTPQFCTKTFLPFSAEGSGVAELGCCGLGSSFSWAPRCVAKAERLTHSTIAAHSVVLLTIRSLKSPERACSFCHAILRPAAAAA